MLANLPEDFVKPLRPYIPVYEELRSDGNWFEGELAFDANAEALELDTEDLDDGKVKVTINAGTFGVTYMEDGANVGSNAIAVDGDCVEVYADGALQDSGCIGDDEYAADLGLDEIFFVVSEDDRRLPVRPGRDPGGVRRDRGRRADRRRGRPDHRGPRELRSGSRGPVVA